MLSWVSCFIPYVWLSHLVSSLQRAPSGPPAINTIGARAKVQTGRRFFRMARPEVYFTQHPVIHSSHTFSLVMSCRPCPGPSVRTSAGLIYPMVQRHTYIVNLSSCCCSVIRHHHHQCLDSIRGGGIYLVAAQGRRPSITKSPWSVLAPKTLWQHLIITCHLL